MRVLIWGAGAVYSRCYAGIKLQEVLGITAEEKMYAMIDGYSFVHKTDVADLHPEIILAAVAKRNMSSVIDEAEQLGFSRTQIIRADIFCQPWFVMDEYLHLKKSPPSVFSMNCWGGNL